MNLLCVFITIYVIACADQITKDDFAIKKDEFTKWLHEEVLYIPFLIMLHMLLQFYHYSLANN